MQKLPIYAIAILYFVGFFHSFPANAFDKVVDNDEVGAEFEQELESNPSILQEYLSNQLNFASATEALYKFEYVIGNISRFLESKFDLFILVNTADRGSPNDFVRPQHLRIFKRNRPGAAIFPRDAQGRIALRDFTTNSNLNGYSREQILLGWLEDQAYSNGDVSVYHNIPVSTGSTAVSGGILTYSGIFRVNKSRSQVALSTSPEAAMSYAAYIDYVYADGRESGVAIHGTPTSQHSKLGVQRASHGCVRTYPPFAQRNYGLLMSPAMQANDLPDFDRYGVIPTADVQNGHGRTRPGIKALFIFFDGYTN